MSQSSNSWDLPVSLDFELSNKSDTSSISTKFIVEDSCLESNYGSDEDVYSEGTKQTVFSEETIHCLVELEKLYLKLQSGEEKNGHSSDSGSYSGFESCHSYSSQMTKRKQIRKTKYKRSQIFSSKATSFDSDDDNSKPPDKSMIPISFKILYKKFLTFCEIELFFTSNDTITTGSTKCDENSRDNVIMVLFYDNIKVLISNEMKPFEEKLIINVHDLLKKKEILKRIIIPTKETRPYVKVEIKSFTTAIYHGILLHNMEENENPEKLFSPKIDSSYVSTIELGLNIDFPDDKDHFYKVPNNVDDQPSSSGQIYGNSDNLYNGPRKILYNRLKKIESNDDESSENDVSFSQFTMIQKSSKIDIYVVAFCQSNMVPFNHEHNIEIFITAQLQEDIRNRIESIKNGNDRSQKCMNDVFKLSQDGALRLQMVCDNDNILIRPTENADCIIPVKDILEQHPQPIAKFLILYPNDENALMQRSSYCQLNVICTNEEKFFPMLLKWQQRNEPNAGVNTVNNQTINNYNDHRSLFSLRDLQNTEVNLGNAIQPPPPNQGRAIRRHRTDCVIS